MGPTFPHNIIPATANNMTGTSAVTSQVIDMRTQYAAAIAMYWTGTPTGSFSIQGSVDYSPNPKPGGSPLNAGTWDDMGITTANAPAGSSGHTLVDIQATGIPYIRVVYTNSGGTGTLSSMAHSK